MSALVCPVRGCARPLTGASGRLACARGHAFDVARSGYVNLLQPQDRKSLRPGDSAATLAARRRVLAHDAEARIAATIVDLLALEASDAVLEVGCGEGQHLAAIAARFGCEGHGLDISVAAIDAAARAHPGLHWAVGNADRALPYADGLFRLVASITARRNAAEFRRVLRDDGAVLVVVPGPDDLVELRAAVLGEGVARDRVPGTVASLAPRFALARHERVRERARLEGAMLHDVMTASYRGMRGRQRERLAELDALEVTLCRDALLFRPAVALP